MKNIHKIPEDILKKASDGNIEAFEEIYKSASNFIYNIALRITNNREDAEEVTHDVFIKIYKNLKNFGYRSSFTTWIYRIAVNTALTACRKRSRELKRTTLYTDAIKIRYIEEIVEEEKTKERNETLLSSILDILNPDQRACIVLRDIHELSYKEIAKTLNININTVRSRLKRARKKLLAFVRKGGAVE